MLDATFPQDASVPIPSPAASGITGIELAIGALVVALVMLIAIPGRCMVWGAKRTACEREYERCMARRRNGTESRFCENAQLQCIQRVNQDQPSYC